MNENKLAYCKQTPNSDIDCVTSLARNISQLGNLTGPIHCA